jgi:hypothetical protein
MTVDFMDDQAELTLALSEVCNLLWREREVLENVVYRLIQQELVLKAGQIRWLAAANAEVEAASVALQGNEVLRSMECDALADLLGLMPGVTLAQLVEAAPEPWAGLLNEHRDALRELAFELDTAVENNQQLLGAGSRAVRETLLSISDAVATYDSRGVPAAVGAHLSRLDAQA